MTEAIKYDFQDYQAIHPDRIVRLTRVKKWVKQTFSQAQENDQVYTGLAYEPVPKPKRQAVKLERKYHNFVISQNSKKNIASKCMWLYRLAKSRTVTTYTKKQIYNFRCGFYTLTLPAQQMHPTSVILSECWEKLLTQLRNVLKMNNYVWKLEFQKNGNVHFHLLSDTYIDYFYLRKAWNTHLERLRYITAYADKFSSMSFADYKAGFQINSDDDLKRVASWYEQGRRSKWQNPNTADVKNVTSDKAMAFYLSKYISKESTPGGNAEFDNEDNSFGLRLAFWSRSLSRCVAVCMPIDYFDFDIERVYESFGGILRCVFDYCRCYYYEINQMTDFAKSYFYRYFAKLRDCFDFVPAV